MYTQENDGFLSDGFNKKKMPCSFACTKNPIYLKIQSAGKLECLGKKQWPEINQVEAWLLSAETATFMKWGGLGMVASELAENFNSTFAAQNHRISILTPMYLGNTGKKNAYFQNEIYTGSEGNSLKVKKIASFRVPFINTKKTLSSNLVTAYKGTFKNVNYIFLNCQRFFSIAPHKENPSSQDGCYILNEYHINEVERFAFFSKAAYTLLKLCHQNKIKELSTPNSLITNDWHSGAFVALCKYLPHFEEKDRKITSQSAQEIAQTPIIHIAHHLGYQGWDYPLTLKILNSLYENHAAEIFKNAKAVKHSNPRTANTLIVYDCYNQASASFHLADRVITVSKNYMEEVSKERGFGYDFRDILKIRKNHRTFFGIVNGYDKKLIVPSASKIEHINTYFKNYHFKSYDETSLQDKIQNKKECIRLLSEIAVSQDYKQQIIPLINIHEFQDISKLAAKADKIPFICATSRLVEQKGYDIAAESILKLAEEKKRPREEFPIIVLGGAGDERQFEILKKLKDEITRLNPKAAERIFVFRGYCDEFAYALQLAADFYLMPSRFEPCGLTQMEAMAKATLPIAMSTGGLVDTINDGIDGFRTEVFFSNGERVYGTNSKAQKFKNNTNAYADALHKALNCFYHSPKTFKQMRINAMKKDFSWIEQNGSVYKYCKLLQTGSI